MLRTVKKNLHFIAAVALVLTLFIGLRWIDLQDSLLFYNDMGRDYLVLLDWAETGKPPLLGPQTSVVSYNQSAWYFYFLYPFFLLSSYSALSSTATVIFFGSTVFTGLLWLTRKEPKFFWLVMIVSVLLAIHPQMVMQNRFVWNPSFVPFFLFVSLVSSLYLKRQFNWWYAALFWMNLAFAVGFSYSALPFALCLSTVVLWINRKQLVNHLFIASTAAGTVLLPTIAFEIRHSFALTKLFMHGQTTPQEVLPLFIRISQLQNLLLPTQNVKQGTYFLGFALVLLSLGVYKATKTTYKHLNLLIILAALFLVSIFIQLLLPINLEKHYIFPLLVLMFATIAVLPKQWSLILTSCLALYWLQPYFLNMYTARPVRSIPEMESCYARYCETHKDPFYISMDSGILAGYHNAPEHRFFMRKMGCTVPDIEKTQHEASTMVVINDATEFTPGKSGYRELTLFGPYTAGEKIICTQSLSLQELHKPTTDTATENILQPQ